MIVLLFPYPIIFSVGSHGIQKQFLYDHQVQLHTHLFYFIIQKSFLLKLMSLFICSCRPISDVSSDLTVQVGSSSFCLHKVKNKKKNKNTRTLKVKTENPLFLSCIEVACLLF